MAGNPRRQMRHKKAAFGVRIVQHCAIRRGKLCIKSCLRGAGGSFLAADSMTQPLCAQYIKISLCFFNLQRLGHVVEPTGIDNL